MLRDSGGEGKQTASCFDRHHLYLILLIHKNRLRKGLRPDIYQIFTLTKLNKLFDIYDSEEQALEGL